MTAVHHEHSIGEIAHLIRERLVSAGLHLVPKSVSIEPSTDGLGDDAWRIVLVLPAPTDDTWDTEDVFDVRRAATDVLSDLVQGTKNELPGHALAVVTTDEASESDIALDDLPESGEDPNEPGEDPSEPGEDGA